MALSKSTIEDGLNGMTLYTVESDAAEALASVYDSYFLEAMANGVPVTEGSTELAKGAFQTALVGMSGAGQGATKLASAVTAYWNAIVLAATSVFVGCTVISPPPTLGLISASLVLVFAQNIAERSSKTVCSGRIAGVLHDNSADATATFPPSLVATIE